MKRHLEFVTINQAAEMAGQTPAVILEKIKAEKIKSYEASVEIPIGDGQNGVPDVHRKQILLVNPQDVIRGYSIKHKRSRARTTD